MITVHVTDAERGKRSTSGAATARSACATQSLVCGCEEAVVHAALERLVADLLAVDGQPASGAVPAPLKGGGTGTVAQPGPTLEHVRDLLLDAGAGPEAFEEMGLLR